MSEQPNSPSGAVDDSWKPPSLRAAESALAETMEKSRKMIAQVEEKLAKMPDVDLTAKPQDIAAIKAAAERPDAPAEMRELKKKVDAGELTWKDILEGKALQDPTVRAAMSGRLGEMKEIYEEVEEGASLEDILEARGVQPGSVMGTDSGATHSQSAPATPTEEEYFQQNRMVSDRTPPPAQPPTPPPPPAPPVPPAPPQQHQQPRRAQPPARRPEPSSDDYFEDPLAKHDEPKSPPTPPRGTSRPKGRRDDDGEDDDFFGGPLLR
jgi:hypothetical protein